MGMALPKFIIENWSYKDKENKICLKENAPEWKKIKNGDKIITKETPYWEIKIEDWLALRRLGAFLLQKSKMPH